jgi:hypothetical protein
MGGFLLVRKSDGGDRIMEDRALRVFERKGLDERTRVTRPQFVLYLYKKLLGNEQRLVEFDDDLIAVVGTLVYKGRTGTEAYTELYHDYVAGQEVDKDLAGNYCVIIYHAGEITTFIDRPGWYRVYHDPDFRVLSSSFLAASRAMPSLTVSPHELYEYVFYGCFFWKSTLFKQVRILNHNHIWKLGTDPKSSYRPPHYDKFPPGASFDQMAEMVSENILRYFVMMGQAYGKQFAIGLSGGFDSRMLLAALRNLGYPTHVYVYGSKTSTDVTVACAVAKGEGFAIDHVDRRPATTSRIDDWQEILRRDFYFFDGVKAVGLFDNGADYESRFDRARQTNIHLNGSGGEIFRQLWDLPNRNISVAGFLRAGYDFGDFGMLPNGEDAFFEDLAEKTRDILQVTQCPVERDQLNRRQVDMLFPLLRNVFGTMNLVANNQISPSTLVYMEPRFVHQSFDIPFEYKNCCRFQSAVMCRLDASIAKYDSQYGFNFFDPPSLNYRARTWLRHRAPTWLLKMNRKRRDRQEARPSLLTGEYFSSIFDRQELAIREFLDPDALYNAEHLLRAYSAELVIGEYF